MEQSKNVCRPPEYTMDDVSEFFEREKARALRLNEIESIIGDNYDLDRLRELVEADRDGRCVVLPISTPEMAYTVNPRDGTISSGFYHSPCAVLHDTERGYIVVKTRKAAVAALKNRSGGTV